MCFRLPGPGKMARDGQDSAGTDDPGLARDLSNEGPKSAPELAANYG
jgi:hypothetical protein